MTSPSGAAPVILCRVDAAGALIGNTNPTTEQIVEVNVDLGGRFGPDGHVDRLVFNDIADDAVAGQRHAAGAAIHVDAGRARCRVVGDIRPVEGNIVAGNQVPGEGRPGRSEEHTSEL